MKHTHLSIFMLAVLLASPFVLAVAPTISGIDVTPSTTTASVNWTANATSYLNRVYYGETASLGSTATTAVNNSTPRVSITALDTDTIYYYLVMSCDNASLCTNSSQSSFQTLCSDSAGVMVECDIIEGLPSAGSNLSSFLSNLAPGIGGFVLLVGIFLAIGMIIMGIAGGITKIKWNGK